MMKGSITKRLFLFIFIAVLGFTALILLSNTLLLRPLYYQSIQNTLLQAMGTVSEIDYTEESDVWLDKLSTLNIGKSYDVVIRTNEEVVFSSSSEFGLLPRHNLTQGGGPRQNGLLFDIKLIEGSDALKEAGEGTYIGTVVRPGDKIALMVCLKELPDGVTVVLTQPIEPINQSVLQSNILLLGCALIALIIFSIFAFRLSKRFTEPIRKIQSTVEEMATLNFGHRCDVDTGDELESLGNDVNRLGDELKSAMETLRLQNAQLEKDIVTQKQFISNASHELRTPLSLIKGYADEMNMGYIKDPQQRDAYVEIIAEEAAKMSRLLKEMLELSRMESGIIEMQYKTLPVGDQIRGFLDKYDGFITDNKLNITVKLDEGDTAKIDPIRFEQVLANYISNAAKYGDSQKQIEISTEVYSDRIRISVFNSGPSVPEDKRSELWNSFYKTDDARTRADDSYGLGLSIVKAIQTVAGQGFGVKNVDGGVVFWFDVARV